MGMCEIFVILFFCAISSLVICDENIKKIALMTTASDLLTNSNRTCVREKLNVQKFSFNKPPAEVTMSEAFAMIACINDDFFDAQFRKAVMAARRDDFAENFECFQQFLVREAASDLQFFTRSARMSMTTGMCENFIENSADEFHRMFSKEHFFYSVYGRQLLAFAKFALMGNRNYSEGMKDAMMNTMRGEIKRAYDEKLRAMGGASGGSEIGARIFYESY
jgi:hypothetical protein